MNVSAKDKATGKEQKITITSSGGLEQQEIDRMVKEAAEHESEDKKAKEAIEKKHRLESLISEIEKTLNENKEKLPQEEVDKTTTALEVAKKAATDHADNAEELQKATDELLKASHKVAEILYKKEEQPETPETDDTTKQDTDKSMDEGPIDVEAQ